MCHGERVFWFEGVRTSACVFQTEEGYDKVLFHLSFFLTSAIIPLSLISVLYMGMLTRLWRGAPGCRISAESRWVNESECSGGSVSLPPGPALCSSLLLLMETLNYHLNNCLMGINVAPRKGKRRVTRLVVVVVLVFAICWCPIQVELHRDSEGDRNKK